MKKRNTRSEEGGGGHTASDKTVRAKPKKIEMLDTNIINYV